MGKPTICIGENKGADQLRSNCEADQRLCFRYTDSTIPRYFLNPKFQASNHLCDCTARLVLDLVGTQIVGFLTHRLISDYGRSRSVGGPGTILYIVFYYILTLMH